LHQQKEKVHSSLTQDLEQTLNIELFTLNFTNMGIFFNNNRNRNNNNRQRAHQDSVAPWEKYAREDDRVQGWYCQHDHDERECDE